MRLLAMRLLALLIAVLVSTTIIWAYFTILNMGSQTAQSLNANPTQYWYLINEWGHGLNWLIAIAAVLVFIYLAVLILMMPKRCYAC